MTNDFLPDVVVLDPKLVLGIPKNIIISTMIDACSHSIEGFVSKIDNNLMSHFALSSLKIIFENMEGIIHKPDDENILNNLQYAALMAGWVQNHCLVGVSHALSHQMGKYDIPHGVANCIFLEESIVLNSKDKSTKKKYEDISRFCGLNGINKLIKVLASFIEYADYPIKLSAYGIERKDFQDIAINSMRDLSAKYNPVDLNEKNNKNIK